jgi:hemerythrin-like metal-binding protein
MPILEWKESFNLGVEQFDFSHRKLVELLNNAHDKFVRDSSKDGLADSLEEFFDCALQHFFAEERYMEEHNYTGYAQHLELHRSFAAQAELMQKDLRGVWKNLPNEKLAFLRDWLAYDILVADTDYVRFADGLSRKMCA